MNTFDLVASGLPFRARSAPPSAYVTSGTLLARNKPDDVPFRGFRVVKGVFSPEVISHIRNSYFSRFSKKEYQPVDNDWTHLSSNTCEHGTGSHPSKTFVRDPLFLDFIQSPILANIASVLLGTDSSVLCPRAIVRSFSHLSPRCTYAHRDSDYFKAPPNTAITAWIPIGRVDIPNGQLIYLQDSELHQEKITRLVQPDRTISKDLAFLASELNLNWIVPEINIGDVVFHCLNNVHASFDTSSNVPRLSCDLRFSISSELVDSRWNTFWSGDDGL